LLLRQLGGYLLLGPTLDQRLDPPPQLGQQRVVGIGPDNIFDNIGIDVGELDFHAGEHIGRDRHSPAAMPVPWPIC
jgi:hypothetical protein